MVSEKTFLDHLCGRTDADSKRFRIHYKRSVSVAISVSVSVYQCEYTVYHENWSYLPAAREGYVFSGVSLSNGGGGSVSLVPCLLGGGRYMGVWGMRGMLSTG